ncbi:DUF1559 domain-containing protein [Planctomycetes bacterium K23_9]|uniref:DUF1559 domain-containing protein n=1 Tax=Stieleria marina TaxID=1930275 RepID=A0A517NXA2_9BACT|nr:hypothetical protein K239x_37510 [Planctomycetes bacterium K23_9]
MLCCTLPDHRRSLLSRCTTLSRLASSKDTALSDAVVRPQWKTAYLILLIAALLSASVAQSSVAQDGAARKKIGDQYIPVDGIAAGVLQPAKLMSCEATALYPLEIAEAWCLDNIGFSPRICDSVRVISATPGPSGPMAAVIVKLNQPFAIGDLNPQLVRADAVTEVDGLSCLPINGPPGVVVHQPDPKTIIVASTNYLETLVDAAGGGQPGQLAQLASNVSHDGHLAILLAIEPVRPMINGMLQAFANQLPPQLAPFTELPNLLDAILIRINLDDDQQGAQLAFLAVDDAAADKLETLLADATQMGRDIAMSQIQQNIRDQGVVPDATRAYADRMADRITTMLRPKRTGRRLVLSASPSQGLAAQGMLVALLMPAVSQARFAARGQRARNNLKQIGLAMHNYHSAYRKLPDAVSRDADGKALLSWRVHILPFIEQQALYEEFHLDEPWDSEHNLKLIPKMPDTYKHASMNTPPGQTVYQVPMGEGTMFHSEKPTRFRDVLDGLSNTIMVVETNADAAVQWTKPEDLKIDADNPSKSIGFLNNQASVLYGDGSVQNISENASAAEWSAKISRAGRD